MTEPSTLYLLQASLLRVAMLYNTWCKKGLPVQFPVTPSTIPDQELSASQMEVRRSIETASNSIKEIIQQIDHGDSASKETKSQGIAIKQAGFRSMTDPATTTEVHHSFVVEFLRLNEAGDCVISSTMDTLFKCLTLVNCESVPNPRIPALFRGRANALHKMESTVGRNIVKANLQLQVGKGFCLTDFERISMENWQNAVSTNKELVKVLFGGEPPPPPDDCRWWPLKQHYDEGGTRLIDWTSSPLVALYFACAQWDGTVKTETDGALYALPNPNGMFVSDKKKTKTEPYDTKDSFLKNCGSTMETFFESGEDHSALRLVIDHGDNDRSIAQDGYFMYQANFHEPVTKWSGPPPYKFLVPGSRKIEILQQLHKMGITARKIVRGHQGIVAQDNLNKILWPNGIE